VQSLAVPMSIPATQPLPCVAPAPYLFAPAQRSQPASVLLYRHKNRRRLHPARHHHVRANAKDRPLQQKADRLLADLERIR